MTHSGGKPHTNVGDRGQRYEVRATGYPLAEQNVIGWSNDLWVAEELAAAIRSAPGCTSMEIFDRQNNAPVTNAGVATDSKDRAAGAAPSAAGDGGAGKG